VPLLRNVAGSYLYAFLMDISLTAPIWVLYLRDERGFSLTQITLLELPLFLLIVFAEVPTGAVADRFGRKLSLVLASAILSASLLVYGVATSYPVILLSNLAWGLAFTFRSGADVALLYDSLKQAGREAEFQRTNGRLQALRSAAVLAGLLLGAPLAAATSYGFAIVTSAAICGCALPVALWMREPERPLGAAAGPEGARQSVREPYLRTLGAGVLEAWRSPTLRFVFVFSGIVGACAAGPLLLLHQPWLVAHGVSTAQLGLWQGAVAGIGILASLAAGRMLSGLGERGAFLSLPLTLSLCCASLAAVDRFWIAGAFFGVAFARGLHQPLLADYVNRRIESGRRATLLSVQSVAGNVVMALAWPLAGITTDAFGLPGPFLLYACAALVLGGGALLLWDRAERASLGRAPEVGRLS
jgi:MFS family permease